MRVALNGFGRIGKNFLRAYLDDPDSHKKYSLTAINIGPADIQAVAYMIKYDSLLSTYPHAVVVKGDTLHIGHHAITLLQETDAHKLAWKKWGIDVVIDATGHYTHADDARQHIQAGAKKVIITAPAHGEDITIVPGVNSDAYCQDKHTIISLGSCTTNAIAPLLHVLKKNSDVTHTIASTVHAYTNSQALLDVNPHIKDLRRSRAAAINIIPSTTGAAISVAAVLPEVKNTLVASALRVPVPVVSLAEVTVLVKKGYTPAQVHQWFDDARKTYLQGILAINDEPLVSTDFQGNPHSVIFDHTMTLCNGPLIRVFGWYDNEWAYSNRIKDFLWRMAGGH